MYKVIALFVLLLGFARAQVAPELPAQLVPYSDVITLGLGLLSALLVHPLTAIAKRLGNTSGVTTVFISGILSLIISGGFTLWEAAHTNAGTGLARALVSAFLAFIVANGRYLALVQSSFHGASEALPTIMLNTIDPTVPVTLSDTPTLPVQNGLEKL